MSESQGGGTRAQNCQVRAVAAREKGADAGGRKIRKRVPTMGGNKQLPTMGAKEILKLAEFISIFIVFNNN